MRIPRLLALLPLAVLASAPAALASTATASMSVTLTVNASCGVTTTPMAFPTSNGILTAVTQTATVTATCTNTTPYAIALGNGANSSSAAARVMKDTNGDTITYSLYSDSGYTTVWGTGAGNGTTVAGTGNGSGQALTVYGKVPVPATQPTPGAYTDTVAVPLTY